MSLANGCNITKSEKFKGVWILSVPTVYIKHDDVLSSVHRKHLKAFWTFVNTLVKCKHQFVLIANWVSQRPWSQFEFNLTRGSKVSLQPHWRRLPPRVSVLSQERSSRQSQHSTALHKHTQETLVNKSFHFFSSFSLWVGDMPKISYHIWFFFQPGSLSTIRLFYLQLNEKYSHANLIELTKTSFNAIKTVLRGGHTSQVTFIYIALLTIQIVTKQLHNIKIGKLCQKCKMTSFNTQFSAEGISLLNLVMASSSSVQFK